MKKVLTRAKVTEIDDLSDMILARYAEANQLQGDQYLQGIMNQIRTESDQLTEVIHREHSLSQLEDADAERDQMVTSLNNALCGYSTMPVENLASNGKKLKSIFDNFGVKIIREGYSNESSLIESMLTDFGKDDARQAANNLPGVNEILSCLRQAEDKFKKAREEYDRTKSKDDNLPCATDLKKSLLKLINENLLKYLEGMNLSNPAQYGEFVNRVNVAIDRINDSVNARKSDKKSDDTSEEK